MVSLPRVLIAAAFFAVAVAAIYTVVRPRSRVSPVMWITAFVFDVVTPTPVGNLATRVSAAAVAIFCIVLGVIALTYHTPR